jgi:peptidoglycan-associated lipoprotein
MIANRQIMRAAVLALALASLAACASKPKPAPTAGPASSGEVYTAPSSPGGGPVASGPEAPIPGSERDFVINAGDRIYFDLDQYAVRPDAAPVLEAQAAWLNRYRAVRIRIEGNCDERGTREYNFALGARRAQSVRDFLVGRGVDPSRIEVISYGKERPIDPGSGEDAWQHNRNGHSQITAGSR